MKTKQQRINALLDVCGRLGSLDDPTDAERRTHFMCETACHAYQSCLASDDGFMEQVISSAELAVKMCGATK